ncbi:GL17646 [Drosophila persimilis]|uniref:GL17646 n=1 Tax=Drosophila persimilis TaxID=7234 RepID=B4GI36_DROPE|nr:GL17646 [Drosophila persimilis]
MNEVKPGNGATSAARAICFASPALPPTCHINTLAEAGEAAACSPVSERGEKNSYVLSSIEIVGYARRRGIDAQAEKRRSEEAKPRQVIKQQNFGQPELSDYMP